MKKYICIVMMICLLSVLLAGCKTETVPQRTSTGGKVSETEILARDQWGDYFDHLDAEKQSWAESVSLDNLPVQIKTEWFNIAGVDEKVFSDRKQIIAVFNSLASMNLGREGSCADDNSIGIVFIMEDGTEISFSFSDDNVEIWENGKFCYYEVSMSEQLKQLFDMAKER